MSNINLNLAEENSSQKNAKAFSSSIIISSICLILVIVLYGVLVVMNKNLNSRIDEANIRYEQEYDNFLKGNANAIIDFESRSKAADSLMKTDQKTTEILKEIESSILPSVYLTSFKYDKDKKMVSLSCVGDNFNTVAKQVLSFKENSLFAEVIPGSSVVNSEKKQLDFSIDIKIK